MSSAATNMVVEREVDPLLKDLSDKKNSIRRNVVSLAAELKEVRTRLAFQEQSCSREILSRQEAEVKAKRMEEKMYSLQKSIEQRNLQLQASASTSEKELDDLRSCLSANQASAGSSAASAESAQLQCLALLKELDEKNLSLKEHDLRVNNLAEQLELLQKDLQSRECSQKQLKDEVVRIEHNVMHALAESGTKKDGELRKIVHKVSPISSVNINKLLSTKEEEISKLRDEIRITSAHWKCKTKELESQLENHTRADQELKKKVLKLEFCLHEARAQTRKLQRMGERRNKALKELREQLARMNHKKGTDNVENMNFWETSKFKIVVSMSMLVLVLFSKR